MVQGNYPQGATQGIYGRPSYDKRTKVFSPAAEGVTPPPPSDTLISDPVEAMLLLLRAPAVAGSQKEGPEPRKTATVCTVEQDRLLLDGALPLLLSYCVHSSGGGPVNRTPMGKA